MGDLLDGVLLASVEVFAMLIIWIFIVTGAVLLSGFACWFANAAIRFAVRELRSKGLSQGRHMEETPSASAL